MPHRRRHPPNLPIAPLRQCDRYPAIRHGLSEPHRRITRPERGWINPFDVGRQSLAILQNYPAPQGFKRIIADLTLHLHKISLGQLELRAGNASL
jgi:hypothetical protein